MNNKITHKAIILAVAIGIVHICFDYFYLNRVTIDTIISVALLIVTSFIVSRLIPKKDTLDHYFSETDEPTYTAKERELQERFDLFFSSSPIPTWISRLSDGMYEAVNPAFTKFSGYTQEELLGRSAIELYFFLHKNDRQAITSKLKEFGFVENIDINVRDKYGKIISALASAKCFHYKNDIYLVGTVIDITERKHMEEQLTHSETLLSQIQKLTHTGLWELNLHTMEIWASENAYSIYGLPSDRKYSWTEVNELVLKDDRDFYLSRVKSLLEYDEPFDITFRLHRNKDGKLRYIHAVTSVLRDENGIAYKLLGEIQDITDKKILEEEYSQIIQTTMAGFWLCDMHGNIINTNEAFCEMLGYSSSELIGLSILDTLYHKTQEDLENRISQIKQMGSVRFQTRHRNKNGSILEVETSASYMPMSDNVCAFTRDVTEKYRAEKALKSSEEQFRLLVSQMQLGLAVHEIICDKNGNPIDYRYLSLNKSYEELTGLKAENIVGKTALEVFPTMEKHWIELYGKVALTGEPYQYEDYTPDGKYYAVSAYAPKINQFAVIVNDVSEKRKAEEKILSLSYHDQLTGLYNRRYYEEEIHSLNKDKNCLPLSIIMADINGLKLTNDVFGHEAGDALLTTVATIFKKECKETDIIARIGGDEFVILLPRSNPVDTKKLVEQIANAVSNQVMKNVVLSISMGHATKYNSFMNISEVFKDAEDIMYRNKLIESAQMKRSTIQYIMNTLYKKNIREMHHFQAVSNICGIFAKELDLDQERTKKLKTAGLMHDIGKISLNIDTLNTPGKLDFQDWVELKRHAETGYRILSSNDEYSDIARYVLEHHERWDGEGYPKGLKGEEITLQARIITLADAFDAMTTSRTYARTLSVEEAIQEIRDNAGTQFDPKLSELFIEKILPQIDTSKMN